MDQRLIVFVRAPRVGAVKTRLATQLGPEAAAAAYRQIVETLLESLAPLFRVELHFSPADAKAEISPWLRAGWPVRAQADGDLGNRMHSAFVNAFSQGAGRVALIGSDCPYVTANDIEDAWGRLAGADVILGPALDGGYWLIALRQPQEVLFKHIAWSTSSVLSQTLRSAAELGLKTELVRTLRDVDTFEDWQYFLASR